MIRLLLVVGLLLGCDAPREIWEATTRNRRYRAVLDQVIDETETNLARMEAHRAAIIDREHDYHERVAMAQTHLERALLGLNHRGTDPDPDEMLEEIRVVRRHLEELRRERAEMDGLRHSRPRRCPVHGDWMHREVVETATSDADWGTRWRLAARIELWRYPHHGGASYFSTTQYLPLSRPWICDRCRAARAEWTARLEQFARGSYPPDAEHVAIEVVESIEANRVHCERALRAQRIEPPFYIAASFAVHPDGTIDPPTLVGTEAALETELSGCLTAAVTAARVAIPPRESVEMVRLPMWREEL